MRLFSATMILEMVRDAYNVVHSRDEPEQTIGASKMFVELVNNVADSLDLGVEDMLDVLVELNVPTGSFIHERLLLDASRREAAAA